MHFAFVPLTFIYAAICPLVHAMALEVVLNELSFVLGAFLGAFIHDLALARPATMKILTIVSRAIRKRQHTLTVLPSRFPLALVHGPICQGAYAITVGHVCDPRTNIDTAVGILERTKSNGSALAKLTTVNASIREPL